MKQHIKIEQLHEYIKPNAKWNDKAINKCFEILKLPKHKILSPELFTIGKMLEILENRFSHMSFRKSKKEKHYQVCIDPIELCFEGFKIVRAYDSEELCDALWKAIINTVLN